MIAWFTSTTIGKCLVTLLVSMVPVIECRGSIPIGVGMGLPLILAYIVAIIGNLIPVPFVIFFIEKIIEVFKKMWKPFRRFAEWLEEKVEKNRGKLDKFGMLGLFILVAVPLPGTGAYTGALVAAVLKVKKRQAFPAIILGVLTAATIMIIVTYGVAIFVL